MYSMLWGYEPRGVDVAYLSHSLAHTDTAFCAFSTQHMAKLGRERERKERGGLRLMSLSWSEEEADHASSC